MPEGRKIATCCYCGTRAALLLSGETRHELICSSCGAPLHALKHMPVAPKTSRAKPVKPSKPDKRVVSREKYHKPKKKKKKSKVWGKLFDEIGDLIEDIFD